MIKDLEFEQHNNLMVISCLPIYFLRAFKILNKFACTQTIVHEKSIDVQIELLHLICRLANQKEIYRLLRLMTFDDDVWIKMLDERFDVINYFYEDKRVKICEIIAKKDAQLNCKKYLNFFGIKWFPNAPKYRIPETAHIVHENEQKRIYDKMSQTNYLLKFIGDNLILHSPRKYTPIRDDDMENKRFNRFFIG
jgi:hypothetical protein